jgi:hypothetical protein
MGWKKYLVLGILFVLPITVYLFFASGVNQFAKLPKLSEKPIFINTLVDQNGRDLTTIDKITILGFLGQDVLKHKAEVFNLAHKIYKKNYQFEDFQMLFLATRDQDSAVDALKQEFTQIADPVNFRVALTNLDSITEIHHQLNTPHPLDELGASSYVYIIDKESQLRGREQSQYQEFGMGYDAANYAIINNEMNDDIKIILAEYRLALKKYKSSRKK